MDADGVGPEQCQKSLVRTLEQNRDFLRVPLIRTVRREERYANTTRSEPPALGRSPWGEQ